MIVFPNSKINLGLHILQKRSDGFHDIETVFYPVAIRDGLEIIESKNDDGGVEFTASGIQINGKADDNLCLQAYHLLKKDFPQLPFIRLHLHKSIPVGAGLGGGSSDGAHTLLLLNRKYDLGLNQDQLLRYALLLGSDCPFFIVNKPCLATGRGEVLSPVPVDLSSYKLITVNPGIHIQTKWAFQQVHPDAGRQALSHVINLPVSQWKDHLHNDFEAPVFYHHPELKNIKDILYKQGAVFASMSGSGSTLFGLFEPMAEHEFNFQQHYLVKEIIPQDVA